MYFLLNDTVIQLSANDIGPQAMAHRFANVSFDYVLSLGRELYARTPLLHRHSPAQAMKLASLIVAKEPEVNAALFVAPTAGCSADHVAVRFASVDMNLIGSLYRAHNDGLLTAVMADREVWRRLAA